MTVLRICTIGLQETSSITSKETLGYKTEIAYAAAFVAREICRAEKCTDGDKFFKSHCWRVGSHGHDWKIMATGFLYHIVEDLDYNAQRLVELTKEKLAEWMREPENDFWRYDFDEEELRFIRHFE